MEPNTTDHPTVPEPSVEQQLREIAEQCALKLKAYRAIRLAEGKPARASEVAAIYQEDFHAAYALGLRHMREQSERAALNEKVDAEVTREPADESYNLACDHIAAAIRNLPVGGK